MGAAHSFTRRHIISSSLAARRARYSGSLLLPKVNNKKEPLLWMNTRPSEPKKALSSVFRSHWPDLVVRKAALLLGGQERYPRQWDRGRRGTTAWAWGAGFLHKRTFKRAWKGWSPQPHYSLREVSCTCMGDLATGRYLEGRKTKLNKGTCKKEKCGWILSFLYWADAARFLLAYSLPLS